MALIAVGGGQPKHAIWIVPFAILTWLSLFQARRAKGCQHVRLFKRDGCFFSLSVWDSPADMKRYATAGSHAKALRASAWMVDWFRFHHYHHEPRVRVNDAYALWLGVHGHLIRQNAAA